MGSNFVEAKSFKPRLSLNKMSQETIKKNDFVELKFTGYANGEIFDSNIPEDLKKISEKSEAEILIVSVGNGMVVKGLDKDLENKELNKEYEVSFSAKEGFGERNRGLIKIVPLSAFAGQKIAPRPGMVFALEQTLVKVIAVSGARVTVDFNNPLAGKPLKYRYKIIRKVDDAKQKAETLFKFFFRFTPQHEIKENKLIVKLPKGLESMISHYAPKFKELANLDLEFEELKKSEKEKAHEHSHEGHEHHNHTH